MAEAEAARFHFIPDATIPDVKLVVPIVHTDMRGTFAETFRFSEMQRPLGLPPAGFVQTNLSRSEAYTMRGLHYQLRKPQGKLILCTHGAICDVAVDLRKESPTFGKWTAIALNETEQNMLWVPPGFAHGFLTSDRGAVVTYFCTTYYDPTSERSLRWNDPEMNISWPHRKGQPVLISDKDRKAPSFQEIVDSEDLFP